jgi:hypothetical protein
MKTVRLRHTNKFNAFYIGKKLITRGCVAEIPLLAIEAFLKTKGGKMIFDKTIEVVTEKKDPRNSTIILGDQIAKERVRIKKILAERKAKLEKKVKADKKETKPKSD